MNKKVGIVLAVFAALLVLCCLGGFFYVKSVADKITGVVAKDQVFVANVLKSTTKNWDENEFSKFADESFNTPEKREGTRKQFALLKQKLGPLVSLGEVVPDSKAFRANTGGKANGFFVSMTAKAKFEKGDGVFTVVVKNYQDKMTITSIGIDPDNSPGKVNPGSNNP
jgi:hypothetical protein